MAVKPAYPRGVTLAAQARARGGTTEVSAQYRCSKCAISYDVPHGDKAQCPMCALEKETRKLALYLQEAQDKVYNLEKQLASMSAHVDQVSAMRAALDLMNPEDMAWLKSVMYRYREDRSIMLMATAPTTRNGRVIPGQTARTLFTLVQRDRDNEVYKPTSIGLVAIVGYYDEITRELGAKQAMAYLLRALGQILTGGRVRD